MRSQENCPAWWRSIEEEIHSPRKKDAQLAPVLAAYLDWLIRLVSAVSSKLQEGVPQKPQSSSPSSTNEPNVLILSKNLGLPSKVGRSS